ncbi:MAG: hypothetical protein AMJ72_10905 [Acidithiobacillales bacterium SM1_46]|nr:MAG: hypothetical protein AMJ72_10905 [Acidithiobacillales bacterium SM1_46]
MSESQIIPSAPPPVGVSVEDAAWVRVPTRLNPAEVAPLLRDTEVLLRLNPYYHFRELRETGTNSFHAAFENQSNNQQLEVDVSVESGPADGMTLRYHSGIKRRTIVSIEPFERGSYVVLTDDYAGLSETERKEREAEVDKSLVAWGEAVRVYLLRIRRYSWIPGWRWYIRRVWIGMKPNQRRIVWLLYLITIVEFFFFLFVILMLNVVQLERAL